MLFQDALLLVSSKFLTGVSYVIVKYGLAYFPPLTLIGLRFLIVGLMLLPFYYKVKMNWFKMFLLGLIMCSGFQTLIVVAISSGLDVATSIICQQMFVPFTSILGVLIYNEQIGKRRAVGLIVAFIGIMVVVGSPTISASNSVGIMLALGSAFFYAVSNILVKKISNISPLAILCATSITTAPFQILLGFLVEDTSVEFIINAPVSAWLSILYLAILTSIVSFGVWIKMLQKYSVHLVAPFGALVPVFGILVASVVERSYSIQTLLGALIVTIGISIININKLTIKKFMRIK